MTLDGARQDTNMRYDSHMEPSIEHGLIAPIRKSLDSNLVILDDLDAWDTYLFQAALRTSNNSPALAAIVCENTGPVFLEEDLVSDADLQNTAGSHIAHHSISNR